MNWGGFAGGFAQGFQNGVSMGKTFKEAMKEHKLQKIREQGIAEATAARNEQVNSLIQETGVSGEPPKAAAPKTPEAAAPAPLPMAEDPMTADQGTAPGATPSVQTYSVTPAAQGLSTPRSLDATATPQATGAATPVAQERPAGEPRSITPPAAGGIQQGRFTVGGQAFATREEARKAAEKKVPSVTDFVMQTVAPKLQEHYIANGELDKAEQLQTYMESKRGQAAVKQFGKAMTALMFQNDVNAGVQALGDYYNQYIDDGVDFTKGEVGQDGKINITVKRKSDGSESVMSMTKGELVRLGMAHDPAKLFQMGLAQVEKQEAAQAELAKEQRQQKYKLADETRAEQREIRKEGRTAKRDDEKDARDHEQAIELKGLDAELDSAKPGEVGKKVRDLRRLGWSDERIEQYLDKDGEFKKTTNPTERRALVVSDLMKNNPMFSRMTQEQKDAEVDKVMAIIYKDTKAASPAAGGLQPGGKGKGTPWYNPATKQIEYR